LGRGLTSDRASAPARERRGRELGYEARVCYRRRGYGTFEWPQLKLVDAVFFRPLRGGVATARIGANHSLPEQSIYLRRKLDHIGGEFYIQAERQCQIIKQRLLANGHVTGDNARQAPRSIPKACSDPAAAVNSP
jgi:hypothetical protein